MLIAPTGLVPSSNKTFTRLLRARKSGMHSWTP